MMAESKSRVESLTIDNSKLREKLVEMMVNTNNSLTAKLESIQTFSADPGIIEHLTQCNYVRRTRKYPISEKMLISLKRPSTKHEYHGKMNPNC